MYHYDYFWQRRTPRALPATLRPNFRGAGLWQDPDQTHTLAMVDARPWSETVTVSLFDENHRMITGTGPDARSAYREAYRRQRLARYDTAALRRQVATLQRQPGHDPGQALDHLNRRITELASRQTSPHVSALVDDRRARRRTRHAAVIRARRAALRAQREQYEESLRSCRRLLLEHTKGRGDLILGLAAIRREIVTARQANSHVAHPVPDVTNGDLLDAVRILLKLAAGYAEMHRRATAANARADGLAAVEWMAEHRRL